MSAWHEREPRWEQVRSVDELAGWGAGVPAPRFSGLLAAIGLFCVALAVGVLAGPDQPAGRQAPPAILIAATDVDVEATSSYVPGQSSR
jgi:hypothetical protein